VPRQPRPAWRADLDHSHDAVVVSPRGDITEEVSDDLRRRLAQALDSGKPVVVNMAAAPAMDPTGLAVLVRAHCEAKQRGCLLCLAAPSRFVLTALHTMRLHTVFPVFPDSDAALAWLAAQRRPDDRSDDRCDGRAAGSRPPSVPFQTTTSSRRSPG
jgi:anti-sigma B factor antagonist